MRVWRVVQREVARDVGGDGRRGARRRGGRRRHRHRRRRRVVPDAARATRPKPAALALALPSPRRRHRRRGTRRDNAADRARPEAAGAHGDGGRRRAARSGAGQRRATRSRNGANSRPTRSSTRTPSSEQARAIRADVLANLPALLEQLADNVIAAGGHVCWAATAEDANQLRARRRSPARRHARRQGQVDALGGDRPQPRARSRRHRGDRDRPRRVDHPGRERNAVAHHRARHPPRPRPDRRRVATRRRRRPVRRARGTRRVRSREVAREVPRSRHRHHRRELRRCVDGYVRARHQRGQRPACAARSRRCTSR